MSLTLEEANRILRGAFKSTGAKHQDQRRGLRCRRPAGRISAHGQCDMGKRLCQPGQGHRLGCVRPSERRDGGSRRPANPARDCRSGGRPYNHGPGSSSDHTQWCRRGCLRRQWRHRAAGRRLLPRGHCAVVGHGSRGRLHGTMPSAISQLQVPVLLSSNTSACRLTPAHRLWRRLQFTSEAARHPG